MSTLKAKIIFAVASLVIVTGVCLAFTGVVKYPAERKWAAVAIPAASPCVVTGWEVVEASCSTRNNIRLCYRVMWNVEFMTTLGGKMTAVVSSTKKFGSYLKCHDHGETHDIGTEAKCYYYSDRPNEARWEAPKDKLFLGLLIAGCVLFLSGFVLIWYLQVLTSGPGGQTGTQPDDKVELL